MSFVLEQIEARVLLSSTLAAWRFDTLPADTSTTDIQTSPAPTSGTGTAYTVGMQNTTANGYLYPAAGSTASADASTFLAATGNADTGGTGGSEGSSNGFVWRVKGGQNSAAAIGSQGVQFNVDTTGHTGILVQFDMNPSSVKAEAQFAVEYTTDVQDANPTWVNATNLLDFGPNDTANTQGTVPTIGTSPTDSIYIQNNTSDPNTISGDYATITGPIVGGSNTSWLNDLELDLSSVSAVNGQANFAVRIVNAATGTSETTIAGLGGTAYGFKNWRFNDIVVSASDAAPAAPSITTQPLDLTAGLGGTAKFTAAATGNPKPTVQWQVSTDGGATFTNDTTDSGNTTNTLSVSNITLAESGYQYQAVYTNSQGTQTTTPATLTVSSLPVITMQPASQSVEAGSTVTLIAGDSGTATVQWQVSTDGGSSFSDIPSATSNILTLSATEGLSGNQYQAVFTNGNGSVTTNAATVTVKGTPIVQWNFTTGQAASPGGNTAIGTANSPIPTSQLTSGNTASILGMVNTYDGIPSFPEADIIPLASGVDPNVVDYVWRVRGGGGGGPTGSPGSPDGWSQNAPTGTQGVEFDVNTTGFSNITLNFDWTQGAMGDMQAQYYDGSNWVNVGTPIQATGPDYYGVTAPTTISADATLTADTSTSINVASSSGFYFDQSITVGGIAAVVTGVSSGKLTIVPTASGSVTSGAAVVASPNPTGISIDLQGISYANNNPNLKVRLVAVYDPALPNVIDGNPAVSATSHGQFAHAGSFGLTNDIQVIDLTNFVNTNGAQDVADGQDFTLTLGGQTTGTITYSSDPTTMASNIQAALNAMLGAGSVSVASTIATNTYTPPGPITAYNGFSVTFDGGAYQYQPVPTMTISDANDNVSTWQNATPSTVTTTTTAPYTVTANNSLTISVASSASFTAGNPILLGTITCLISSVGSGTLTVVPETSGSVQTGTTVQQLGVNGYVDGSGNWELGNISFNGVAISGAPGIVTNPGSQSAAAGYPVTFTSTAYSESLPTVQWQVSTDGGSTWSNISGGTVTPTGGVFGTQTADGSYSSTYSFTTDSNLDQNGYQYRAVFTNGSGSNNSSGATLTVVAPQAPYVLIQPTNRSVQQGQNTFFETYGVGSPTPAIQWQVSADGGTTWSNLITSATVDGPTTNTLTITASNDTSMNGYEYRAEFSSSAGTTYSNAVTLTVLATGTILSGWDFNATYPGVPGTDPYVINPAPVGSGVDGSIDVGGTATPIGMNLPYNPSDPATGTAPPGAVDAQDITNAGAAIDTAYSENVWRVRAGINSTTGGAPANGWSNFVDQYTQGAQFSVPTTGYNNIYVTLDWYATHSGEQDAQREYTLDGTNWIPLGDPIHLYAPGSSDFYGDSNLGVVPVVFDLTGVSGANNNPNFGIRLVNSYNLVLSNQQAITLNDNSNFTLTFNGQTTGTINYSAIQATMISNIQSALGALSNVGANNISVSYDSTSGGYVVQFMGTLGTSIQPVMSINTVSGLDTVTQKNQYANAQLNVNGDPYTAVPYNGAKGNWRLDNIFFHGTAISTLPSYITPSNGAAYTWDSGTGNLVLTSGTLTFTADSTTDTADPQPNLTVNGATANVVFDTNQHLASLSLANGASATTTAGGNSTLYVNTLSIDNTSALDLNDNDLVVNNGTGLFTSVQNQVFSGYGATSPIGIYSTTGHATLAGGYPTTILKLVDNAVYATTLNNGSPIADWPLGSGNTISSNAIIGKYTYLGDTNLDGVVTGTDYLAIDSNIGQTDIPGLGALMGDTNFDGYVTGTDYLTIDSQFGYGSGNPLAATTGSAVLTAQASTSSQPLNQQSTVASSPSSSTSTSPFNTANVIGSSSSNDATQPIVLQPVALDTLSLSSPFNLVSVIGSSGTNKDDGSLDAVIN